ncbi:hypothetical protein TUBRATIS_21850 [Tubulinosema ratisbonensis]|uniref:Uncharacterized protein n=1 Tax=Tubulinosema ratisbonensis TaxID=291195 RepID=A0A437AJK4_9MICR|nr:hypothetical protein TUBRATIS_21850 [Tubulinosema ratisbonensis]
MDQSEKSPEQEWEEHFDELVDKLKSLLNSVEMLSTEGLNFNSGDVCSKKEERQKFIELIEKNNPRDVTLFYANKRYVYIRDLENQYSKTPFFLFVSMDLDDIGIKRGMIVTEYCGFILVGTFNNTNSANAVRYFCNCVCENLSQYEMIEE